MTNSGYIIIYLLLSFVCGTVGKSRRIGFLNAFLYGIGFTPFVGIIIAFMSKSIYDERHEEEMLKTLKKIAGEEYQTPLRDTSSWFNRL